ncbi:MAG: hypothetical protein Q7R45_07320 [Sulfuricaulis sp.]|nr:hypothetical protein [Sulfuricaulis sp.]
MPNWPFRTLEQTVVEGLGEDTADNPASTANVVANVDGSAFERLEYIQTTQAVPVADATTNALARDVIGIKTDAAVTTVGTTKSLMAYLKGLLSTQTVPVADAATNVFSRDAVGIKTDAAVTAVGVDKSIMAYAKGAISWLTVAVADAATNASAKDVIGNKTDAAVTAAAVDKSLVGYVKGVLGWIGTIVNVGGTATLGALLGDFANDSLVSRLNDVGSDVNATTTDSIQGKIGTDTELADRSLYDQLNGGGPAAAAAAAAPANDVSLYGALRYVSEQQSERLVSKAYADLVGYDTAAAFTVTGDVLVRVVGVVGAVAITTTSTTTVLSLGTTEAPEAIIANSTMNNTQFAATDVWIDSTPANDAEAMASAAWHVIGGGADIILTRGVDDILGGALTLYCFWKPLSADGAVVAA